MGSSLDVPTGGDVQMLRACRTATERSLQAPHQRSLDTDQIARIDKHVVSPVRAHCGTMRPELKRGSFVPKNTPRFANHEERIEALKDIT